MLTNLIKSLGIQRSGVKICHTELAEDVSLVWFELRSLERAGLEFCETESFRGELPSDRTRLMSSASTALGDLLSRFCHRLPEEWRWEANDVEVLRKNVLWNGPDGGHAFGWSSS